MLVLGGAVYLQSTLASFFKALQTLQKLLCCGIHNLHNGFLPCRMPSVKDICLQAFAINRLLV